MIVTRPCVGDGILFRFPIAFRMIPHHLAGGMTIIGQDGFVAESKPNLLNKKTTISPS